MVDREFSASTPDPRLSAEGFAREQAVLGKCWNFLGFDHQIPDPNDWFVARLGGKSVFVQRFETTIAAFENKCAHRGFPLREGTSGNGPVLCGLHHWRYNAEGWHWAFRIARSCLAKRRARWMRD